MKTRWLEVVAASTFLLTACGGSDSKSNVGGGGNGATSSSAGPGGASGTAGSGTTGTMGGGGSNIGGGGGSTASTSASSTASSTASSSAASSSSSSGGGGAPPVGLHGVYVLINTASASGVASATSAVGIADIDGLAIDLLWSDIAAATPLTYDYSNLDALLKIAQNAQKYAQISIVGADGTPSAWFAPATRIQLQYAPQGGVLGKCFDTDSPPPWDATFLSAWDDMTAQLATHLATAYPGLVQTVRLTGLNTHSPETHLPTQAVSDGGLPACFTTNNPMVWQGAGYTPTKLKQGWTAMINSWATHFPTQDGSLALIEGKRYPAINDAGMLVAWTKAADDALNDALIGIAASAFSGRFVLQKEFLIANEDADPLTVAYANEYGVPTSWQTNLWWVTHLKNNPGDQPGAAACGGADIADATACTAALFLNLMEEGVHPTGLTVPLPGGRTRSIEVFMPDPSIYGAAITQVHGELTP
jgi:hypothetical protein